MTDIKFVGMRDRGRETSDALVEVRTVLSRAETALANLHRRCESWRDPEATWKREDGETFDEWLARAYIYYEDEDLEEMTTALEHVVESLDWWRRTGRPPRRRS